MNVLIIVLAKYLIVPILLAGGLFFLFLDEQSKFRFLNLSILTFPLALVLTKTLALFIHTTRPFVSEHIQPLISHAADNGFPSDHTVLTMTLAAVIFVFNRKAGFMLALLSLSIGLARILAKIHQPLDILGSIFIAILSTYVSWYALKKFKNIDILMTSLISKIWIRKTNIDCLGK